MEKYLLFLSIMLFSGVTKAQTAYKDSLWQIVQTGKTDNDAINAVYKLGEIIANEHLDSADFYFENSLKILEQEDPHNLFKIYGKLSNIYYELDLPYKAIEYADKGIIISLNNRDTSSLINSYINKGNALIWVEDTVNAEKYYRMVLDLSLKTKSDFNTMFAYNNLGLLFSRQGRYDSSSILLNKGIELCTKMGEKTFKIRMMNNIAENYYNQSMFQQANNVMNELVKDTAAAHLSPPVHLDILDNQYDILCGLERYKEATVVMDKYFELKQNFTSQQRHKEMLEFDDRLKKSEQTKQLLLKENELYKQRNLIIYLLVGLGLTALLGIVFFYFQRLKTEVKKKELLNLQREQELKATKAKLEGQFNERIRISKEIHDDLGSSMTSISLLSEVLKKKLDVNVYPEINRISVASSEMVDKMNEIIWTLNIGNDNVQSLVAYIRKFATNFLDDAQLMLEFEAGDLPLEKEIDGSVRRNIYLCTKEAINNIVKHAEAQKIDLKIDLNTEGLTIKIKDDGKGIDEKQASILGNGLKNMQKRMNDIGGQFSVKDNLGTEITLLYPM